MEKRMDPRRKPDWLKIRLPMTSSFAHVKNIIRENKLHTICTSGDCPNMGECWDAGTATFMILGDICTRSCKFCAVKSGKPLPVDYDEPRKLAESIKRLNLKHSVVTSVDRDDLDDGGAFIWSESIRQVKLLNPNTTIEVLIPDFNGVTAHIQSIVDAKPDVISHNLETVRRLTPKVRSRAHYDRSLQVIEYVAKSGIRSKSGIMLGIGETYDEVVKTMKDLRYIGCQVMTIGQYLQPSLKNLDVVEYIRPEVFAQYQQIGLEMGFRFVESGPLVRSSYQAQKHVL
jgi:lipoyl synthase